MSLRRFWFIPFFGCALACHNPASNAENNPSKDSTSAIQLTLTEADSGYLFKLADSLLNALEKDQFDFLSDHVHPVSGLRIAPIVHLDKDDKIFNQKSLKKELTSVDTQMWGYHDGSGEPIRLLYKDYKTQFLFRHSYKNAEKHFVKHPYRFTLTIQNFDTIFNHKQCCIDYTYQPPGYDAESMYLSDWRSLILVFTTYDKRWYLTAIVSNYYTI